MMRRVLPDHDHAVGIGVRQGSYEDGVHGAEHRRVAANSESECYDGRQCEAGISRKSPDAEAKIAGQSHTLLYGTRAGWSREKQAHWSESGRKPVFIRRLTLAPAKMPAKRAFLREFRFTSAPPSRMMWLRKPKTSVSGYVSALAWAEARTPKEQYG
jgi:hypothetical protein